MSKAISAGLTTSIQQETTTLAYCVQIRRKDGRVIRMTDHTLDLSVDNGLYDASIPFELGPIDSGSTMAVDNTELTVFCDETLFVLDHFKKRLYDGAEVEIRLVDWTNVANGSLTVRRGWISICDYNQNKKVSISIVGLLKVLDYPVARVYSPLCNADFGDSRCKIAVNWSQAYRDGNPYQVGQTVYFYDTTSMTALSLTNPGFESDGVRSEGQAITGWTQLDNAAFVVNIASPPPYAGSYSLRGGSDGGANDNGHISTMYQDIDLGTAAGTTNIDDGKISVAVFYRVRHNSSPIADYYKVYLEMLDVNGNVVQYYDPGWQSWDDKGGVTGVWYGDQAITPVIATARTVRIYLSMRKTDGTVPNVSFDDFSAYYWDHTTTTPHSDVIHRYDTQVVEGTVGDGNVTKIDLGDRSFEADGAVAYALNPTVTNWDVAGYAQVTTSAHGLTSQHGSYFLTGGTQGVSHTTDIRFVGAPAAFGLTEAEVDVGDVILTFAGLFGWGDASSTHQVKIGFYDGVPAFDGTGATLIREDTPFNLLNEYVSTPLWSDKTSIHRVPTGTRGIRVNIEMTSPNTMTTAIDNIVLRRQQLQAPEENNQATSSATPLSQGGTLISGFGTTAGDVTLDGEIVWTADAHHNEFATVNTVSNNKAFTVTGLTLGDEYYQGAVMKFLSGSNAGYSANVRIWDQSLDSIKLYTELPFAVSSGDRFQITTNCLKRYSEDCVTKFANGLNFRGFPYIPGRFAGEDNLVTVTTQTT